MNWFNHSLVIYLFLLVFMACTDASEPTETAVLIPSKTGAVVTTNDMTSSRAAHTATLLANGKVLITGGFDNRGLTLASGEIFDPNSRTFIPASPMNVARSSQTATLLTNGKVLIAGGYNNGDYLASAELYDPTTGTFSLTGLMTMARSDQAAVLLNNGNVLIAGGVGTGWTFLATAELYDPETGTFTATGDMTTPRESHTITLLKNGKALITGGHKGRRSAITIYSSAELYNPLTSTFTTTGNLTIKRHKHDATLLPNGKVLISGGSDERDDQGTYTSTEIYSAETGAFTAAANMNAARYKYNGTSVLLKNGKVLLMGGASITEIYDPSTNTFSNVTNSVGATRLFAATALLPNGEVLLSGGYGTNIAASAQAWIFLP